MRPMFQEFRRKNRTRAAYFISYVYDLFFKINSFSKASVFCHNYAKILFKKQYRNY